MAWTEQDYQEIVARLKKDSQGVGDVPEAESLDGITSLPAYQDTEGEDMPKIVRAPLNLLAEPALEAAEKADKAAANADEKASAAETATQSANEAATNTNQAIQNAKTATDAANASASSANQATENANTAASNANSKATLADTAAANANDTAEHPTYIGEDHYVYKWNKTAKAYDKTDIYTKGDAFSIKKVYASVAELEADKSNPDIAEGDFVLVNTGDVEDPDNAKLYVKADGDFEFLVDMSGAIGFTGKTPQFSMGTVTTLEAGASATATVSSDGTDEGGNPKYKLNFAIPRGNPGAPFKPVGQYDTLELLKQAIPDGSDVDGMIAVGTEAPYDYYAWLNGEWVSQGKIDGIGEAPSDGNTYGRKNEGWVEVPEHLNLTSEDLNDINGAGFATQKSIVGYTTPENNYPINENGALIFANANYSRSNQIYGSYLTNRWFARGGGNQQGIRTDWKEFVFTGDVLTKTNTSSFTPTGDYQPATKKYVDDKDRIANIPYSLFGLTSKSSSSQILGVFGGLSSYKSFVNKLRANNCVIVCGSPEDDSYRYVFDNYVTEWTDENNFNLYMYDNSLRSNLPKAFVFQIKLVNNEASFAKEEREFAFKDESISYLLNWPSNGVNITGDFSPIKHSAFGWYNNSNGNSDNSYAPTNTAGFFIRIWSTGADGCTLFFPTVGGLGTMYILKDGEKTPAEIVANMATKEYVYGKAINVSNGTVLVTNANLKGVDAESKVNSIFGSLGNFRNIVKDVISNHTRYFFHSYNSENNCLELSSIYSYYNSAANQYQLQFFVNYYTNRATAKCMAFSITDNTDDAVAIIQDIVTSDNLTTITKKTASEYEAIGSKDEGTMYAITDA